MKTSQMGFDFNAPAKSASVTADAEGSTEPKALTVSQLNSMIRRTLEGQFGKIWVKGEISNFKAHSSGHFYFSLKDDGAQVNAVMFRGHNSKLKFRPENGLEVLIKGKITVYEPRGNYQIFCESMEPVGAGALQKAFEQLKAKLESEGLFKAERKRPLPAFPKHIGVVTSPTGAAIRDILNVLRRRYKGARVTLAPAVVQGDAACASVVKAIQMINRLPDVDVLIVGRGGGSIEDLWCFNEEPVARAIVASGIPVISAVGHEVDFTITDFVADLRAPTPSAAAELVVKNADEILNRLRTDQRRLVTALRTHYAQARDRFKHLNRRLVDPRRRLQDLILRADELSERLDLSMRRFLQDARQRVRLAMKSMGTPREALGRLERRLRLAGQRLGATMQHRLQGDRAELRERMAQLDALSPLKVVERGYSIVSDADGKNIVKDSSRLQVGDLIKLKFAKGSAQAEVKKIES